MRLIDADEFVAELIFLYEDRGWHEREIHFSLADMRCNVDIIPTVDAVEVVRCKDCKYRRIKQDWYGNNGEEFVQCKHWDAPSDMNGFCSWGKRR